MTAIVNPDKSKIKWLHAFFWAFVALALAFWLFSTGESVFVFGFWATFVLAGIIALYVRAGYMLGILGMALAWFIWNMTPWGLSWVQANTYGWLDFVAPALCVILALCAGFTLTYFRKNKASRRTYSA